MKLIVDTSIVIGSLIRRSHLLFKFLKIRKNFELISPDFVRDELLSKIDKISKLSKLSESEVEFAINVLLDYIKIIPKREYRDKIDEAKVIAKQFDEKDTPFIALALKLGIPIWTNDKEMISYALKSGKYLALDTQAVEELIRGKSLNEIRGDLKKRYLTSE